MHKSRPDPALRAACSRTRMLLSTVSRNPASKARIATSFLRCWSELSELLAVCPSQASSPAILLAIDETNWSAAGVRDGTAGTDCSNGNSPGRLIHRTAFWRSDSAGSTTGNRVLRLAGLSFATWDRVNGGNAIGRVSTAADDCTNGMADVTAADTEPCIATPANAETSAAVGANNTWLGGAGVVAIVSLDVATGV